MKTRKEREDGSERVHGFLFVGGEKRFRSGIPVRNGERQKTYLIASLA